MCAVKRGPMMQKVLAFLYVLLVPTSAQMAAAESLPAGGSSMLSGPYDVFQSNRPDLRVTGFSIRSYGQNFSISGVGQNWVGRGRTDGQIGFYDWRFPDGRTGRTDFRINPDGSLQGHAVGTGVDFSFLARRAQSSVQNFTGQSPLQQSQAARPSGTCADQASQCQQCPNGRYRGTGFLCLYDTLSACRTSILQFCKANPSSDKPLVVKGRLTNEQAYELMMSCPNIPHGPIPYSGTPPAPGSKKMKQCEAFYKSYIACGLFGVQDRGKCLRDTYGGP